MNVWLNFDAFEGLEIADSFELIYFRNSFCCRIKNSWSFKYKILGHVSPVGENLTFLFPLELLKFYDFLSHLFILKLSFSKPFYSTWSYASTANIQEVMKFYNQGDKTFETDFSNHMVWMTIKD